MFSDPSSQEKFWKRTGYELHTYAQNYAGLKKYPPQTLILSGIASGLKLVSLTAVIQTLWHGRNDTQM